MVCELQGLREAGGLCAVQTCVLACRELALFRKLERDISWLSGSSQWKLKFVRGERQLVFRSKYLPRW